MTDQTAELAPHLEDAHLIDKRRVTMESGPLLVGHEDDGSPIMAPGHVATDYVRPDQLDAYVADARTRWSIVTVSDEPDAGPLGYHGPTAELDHAATPAGHPPVVTSVTAATPGSQAEQALALGAAQAAEAEAQAADGGEAQA